MTTAEKLQTWQELRDPNLRMQRLLTDRALAQAVLEMQKIEGAKGDTPIKGKDYFTPEEIQAFIDYLRAQVKDGKDGKDGEKGATGSRGATGKDGYTPVRGVDYWTRQDMEELVAAVVGKLPKQSNKKEVVKPISYKDITDAPDVSDLPKLVDFLKKGGFRGGGDTVSAGTGISITRANGLTTISAPSAPGTAVYAENLSSQLPGSTLTLAHTPVAGTVRLYRGGARQIASGTDYTISGVTITLVTGAVVGEIIICDYNY